MSQRFAKFIWILGTVLLLAAMLPAQSSHSSSKKSPKKKSVSHSTSSHHTGKHSSKVRTASSATRCKKGRKCKASVKKVRGQQVIDADRTREIQAALIREHYLDGEPTGEFDQRTKQALMKYQQDNGWQNKVVPDSRALIKLGLGPSKDGLLNPESAAVASPMELGSERDIPGGAPSGRK